MGRARRVASFLVMVGFLASITATKPKRADDADARSDAASAPSSSVDARPIPTPAPAEGAIDVDPVAIAATLGCASKVGNAGCRLLDEFGSADAWVDFPVSDDVWFGETNGIGGIADGKKELFYVQVSRSVGTFSAALHTLLPEDAKSAQDAAKLLAATRLGTELPTSAAASFMRTPSSSGKLAMQKTRGRSQALVQTPPQVFVRAHGRRMLVVEYNGNFVAHESAKGPGSALAWVAEVYRLR